MRPFGLEGKGIDIEMLDLNSRSKIILRITSASAKPDILCQRSINQLLLFHSTWN